MTEVVEKDIFSPSGEKRKRKKKATNVSDKYYYLSEDEMQALIAKAKARDPRAQEELLKVFDNFIMKYCALLYRGKYDLHDYDIRRFISLFIPDRTISVRLTRNQINSATYKAVNEVMERGINYMVRRYCDEIDVRQTVQVTFLQCIDRYERRGSIPFSGYIYSYFFYLLKKNVDFFLISQVGRNTFPLHTDDSVSSSFTHADEQVHSNVPLTASVEEMLGPDRIDEYWVLGETAIFPFDRLTVHQRQLIKWRYVDGLKASHIAEKITEHPNTCRAQIQAIKDELGTIMKEEFDF